MSDFNTAELPIGLVRLIAAARDTYTDAEIAEMVNSLNIIRDADEQNEFFSVFPDLTPRQIRTIDEWLQRYLERKLEKVQGEKAQRASDIEELRGEIGDLRNEIAILDLELQEVKDASATLSHEVLVAARQSHNLHQKALTNVINYLSLPWWKRAFTRYRGSE